MNRAIFEINKVYQEEAAQLTEARNRSKVIHGSGDIDASGDEIEVPFRNFLRRKLPFQYYLSQGHIVDQELRVSPQLDVIVADNNATPILFKGQNGTEYFPYESVYLIGEIKSTYVKSKHYISAFSSKYQGIKATLQRDPTPPTYLGNGINLGEGLSTGVKVPYRNPLFAFMLFVDSGDVDEKDLLSEYSKYSDEFLPNIVCFADGRILAKAEMMEREGAFVVGPMDTGAHRIISRDDIHWFMYNLTDKECKGGQALALLMLSIFEHLQSTVLMNPPINKYLNHILQSTKSSFHLIDSKKLQSIAQRLGIIKTKD
jgi:hypothetical protein